MIFRVVIPPRLLNELLDQAIYIAEDSIDRALTWEAKARETIQDLSEFPEAYPVDDTISQRVGHEVRRRVWGNYLIFYHFDQVNHLVVIERFRHAARNDSRPSSTE